MLVKEKIDKDFDIIEGILSGHKQWYEQLIRKYNQRLYRIAKSILWNESEVEDAMQEAYIKAFQQLPKFEKRSGFATWITKILINECLMLKRRSKSKTSANELINLIDYTTPENATMNKELKNILEGAIATLPEKYRSVFVMREIENMSVAETGESLNISETNVKARLSRAKEMLRNNLTASMPASHLLEFNFVRCDRIVENVMKRI